MMDKYPKKAFENTVFERKVVTFEEYKKSTYPSKNGLYVPEILLLEYCSYGKYPLQQDEYPRFWWFDYGIKDVNTFLKSLEQRGFIRFATPLESVPMLKVDALKGILKGKDLSTKGKKEDLVKRVQENYTNSDLIEIVTDPKYTLTDLGKEELEENEYVVYMHKSPEKTIESDRFGPVFNVWEVNRRLHDSPSTDWHQIVDDIKKDRDDYQEKEKLEREQYIEELEKTDPKLAKELKETDQELEMADQELERENEARRRYQHTGDIETYIHFWEDIWANGGPKQPGSTRTFILPDLYIQQKRYDDALKILNQIKNTQYHDKAVSYINRVKKLKGNGKSSA